MKALETMIDLQISSSEIFLDYLRNNFPANELKYKQFSDIYEIRSGDYMYSLWYNIGKHSVVKTKRKILPKAFVMGYSILIVTFFLMSILNILLDWAVDVNIMILVFLLLTGILTSLVYKFRPELKKSLQDRHEEFVQLLRAFN